MFRFDENDTQKWVKPIITEWEKYIGEKNTFAGTTLFCLLQEKIHVEFECPETSPAEVVSAIDQPPPQVRSNVT